MENMTHLSKYTLKTQVVVLFFFELDKYNSDCDIRSTLIVGMALRWLVSVQLDCRNFMKKRFY